VILSRGSLTRGGGSRPFPSVYNGGVRRQVLQTIAKHGMLQPGNRVCVAVSGGADSVALVHILSELADELGITLALAHLNHKLRGAESDADEEFVRGFAQDIGLRCFTHTVDVGAEARAASQNLEQAGRNCRYQWFTRLLGEGLADKIAVGHTRSDQSETVLYRLLRGAGSAGLAGVRPVLPNGIVRPLIDVSREDVLAYLQAGRHRWREDASNHDLSFERNRIRHELMPHLAQHWNPQIERTLAHLAAWAGDEEDYWRQEVGRLSAALLEQRADGVYLRVSATRNLPAAVLKRLVRQAMERVRGNLRGVDYEHVEAACEMIRSGRGSGRLDLPGVRVARSFDALRITNAGAAQASGAARASGEYSLDLAGAGIYPVPGSAAYIELKLAAGTGLKPGYNERCQRVLDWGKLPKPLKLRSWQPGDCYQPWGRGEAKKLKALFQEGRIALWDRVGWPVVCATEPGVDDPKGQRGGKQTIIWARGFGPSAAFAPDENTKTVLEITEVRPGGA
jgi:tRNA(Ile)-lysidine synthase